MSGLTLAQDLHHDPALHTALAPADAHTWELRGIDFEDGVTLRSFECSGCRAVRFD